MIYEVETHWERTLTAEQLLPVYIMGFHIVFSTSKNTWFTCLSDVSFVGAYEQTTWKFLFALPIIKHLLESVFVRETQIAVSLISKYQLLVGYIKRYLRFRSWASFELWCKVLLLVALTRKRAGRQRELHDSWRRWGWEISGQGAFYGSGCHCTRKLCERHETFDQRRVQLLYDSWTGRLMVQLGS